MQPLDFTRACKGSGGQRRRRPPPGSQAALRSEHDLLRLIPLLGGLLREYAGRQRSG